MPFSGMDRVCPGQTGGVDKRLACWCRFRFRLKAGARFANPQKNEPENGEPDGDFTVTYIKYNY